jgi:hypothetical protein
MLYVGTGHVLRATDRPRTKPWEVLALPVGETECLSIKRFGRLMDADELAALINRVRAPNC